MEAAFEDHLYQPACHEQGRLSQYQVTQRCVQPDLGRFQICPFVLHRLMMKPFLSVYTPSSTHTTILCSNSYSLLFIFLFTEREQMLLGKNVQLKQSRVQAFICLSVNKLLLLQSMLGLFCLVNYMSYQRWSSDAVPANPLHLDIILIADVCQI